MIEGTFTDMKKTLRNHPGMIEDNRKRMVNGFFLAYAKLRETTSKAVGRISSSISTVGLYAIGDSSRVPGQTDDE